MKTLIELYDERPLENVLCTEVFRPERTVFICSKDVADDKKLKQRLRTYMLHRGVATELVFTRAGIYSAADIIKTLRQIIADYDDCALDVSGGTDDALFAAGCVSAETGLPAFTYSRKKNKFFNIMNAEFAKNLPCTVEYSVEDSIIMAGGSLREGRVDNSILKNYLGKIDDYFKIYLNNRRDWTSSVEYIQEISRPLKDGKISLSVSGNYTLKVGRGYKKPAPEALLREYEKIGFIKKLKIEKDKTVSFTFADSWVRTWMRDIGAVLELYTYKQCLDTGMFNDVVTSAVVDWEGDNEKDAVTNELDVVATRGVNQIFISCKTCEVKTEALNELAILRDRFGSKMSKAAIITAKNGGAAMRRRAMELGIDVIDLTDINNGTVGDRLKKLAEI